MPETVLKALKVKSEWWSVSLMRWLPSW